MWFPSRRPDMDRRRWLVAALTGLATVAVLAACSSVTDASAPELGGEIGTSITYGELDGDGHPGVGLVTFVDTEDGQTYRCSGTLLSSTVFLTAGHCTHNATNFQIWFAADAEAGVLGTTYPTDGQRSGTGTTHPDYNPAAFFLADVGIIELDEPWVLADASDYATLPEMNALEELKTKRGKQNTTFTAVGYGLQRINPVFVEAERVRMVATPHLVQINTPGFTGDFSMLLSNNASTGGTCFGDSGGPNFLGDTNVVAGVTSFGINGNCAGTGGVFRMDRQNVLDFVNSFLD
jgi:V8-like Glu-specific endopeptidase